MSFKTLILMALFVYGKPALAQYTDFSVGAKHICALKGEYAYCQGSNDYGQSSVIKFKNPRRIVSGYYHNCVLDDDGVWCWGFNTEEVPPLSEVQDLQASALRTCAKTSQGIQCWGDEVDAGDLPRDFDKFKDTFVFTRHFKCDASDGRMKCWGTDGMVPIIPADTKDVVKLRVGHDEVCALFKDNEIKCWASGGAQKFRKVRPFNDVKGVSLSDATTCLIQISGSECWIHYSNFYLKPPSPEVDLTNVVWTPSVGCLLEKDKVRCFSQGLWKNDRVIPNVSQLVSDKYTSYCALADGVPHCWSEGYSRFDKMNLLRNVTHISGHTDNFCAATEAQYVKCFGTWLGNYESAQLGKIFKLQVNVGGVCALTSNGVWCHGVSNFPAGQFKNASDLVATDYQFCVLENTKVSCFGSQNNEALLVPLRIIPAETIAASRNRICVTGGGKVQCWGSDLFGQTSLGFIERE